MNCLAPEFHPDDGRVYSTHCARDEHSKCGGIAISRKIFGFTECDCCCHDGDRIATRDAIWECGDR